MGSRTIEFYDDGRTWRNTVSNDSVVHSASPDKITFSHVSPQDSISYAPSNDKIHYARGQVMGSIQRRSAFKKVFVAPPPPPPTDPYFSNVVALLHMDGADGSTTFTDVKGRVWTPSGAAQIRTDLSKFGGAAGQFDAAGARITAADAADLRVGTGPWTVEGWFRPQAPVSGFGGFFVKGENSADGISLAITPTVLTFRANGTTDTTASVSLSTTAFTHIAFVYDGTLIKMFAGGTQVGSASRSFNHTSTAALLVGNATSNSNFSYKGRIDELRITAGVARYTANFTPPTEPFLDQ